MPNQQSPTGRPQFERPSPALKRAGPFAGYRRAVATAPRNALIICASAAGVPCHQLAAEHGLSCGRIQQIVAAAGLREHGRAAAFDHLGRRSRDLLERQGLTTVASVLDAWLALPDGERLLQIPGFGHKCLREVRRWLWLQTGDVRVVDRGTRKPQPEGRAASRIARAGV